MGVVPGGQIPAMIYRSADGDRPIAEGVLATRVPERLSGLECSRAVGKVVATMKPLVLNRLLFDRGISHLQVTYADLLTDR